MTDAALAARDGRIGNVAGAVLLGGASRRMGRDKAALAVAGVPGATRTARLLDNLFDEVLLVGGAAPEDCPGRHVPDEPGPRCALRGLATALAAASAPRVFVVATDMPLLTPDLVLALVAWPEADAVVPRAGAAPIRSVRSTRATRCSRSRGNGWRGTISPCAGCWRPCRRRGSSPETWLVSTRRARRSST